MTGQRDAGGKPSLRTRIARHVLVPLVLTWALGSGVALVIAEHFAAEAFDRSLLDDALAMAANVHQEGRDVVLGLTPAEMGTLLFDQSETVYFAVRDPQGTLVAGHAALPAAKVPPGGYEFANVPFGGRMLRTVTLHRTYPTEFLAVMGLTTTSRTQLLKRLLVFSILPQAMLLGLLAWWLRRTIQGDVQPLVQLQQAIDSRDANDLSPLTPGVRTDSAAREVERIGVAVDSLLARLQESLQAQREFAGNVAHELRTPLAGIRAHASFGLAQDDASIWQEQLRGIAHAEQRASRLVDQLLAIARAAESNTSLQLEPIAIGELARDVVLRFLPRADAAGVDLGAEGLDRPLVVQGERALLEGILGNLLDNALRYGRGQPPHITVEAARDGDDVVLRVVDNGPGLEGHDPKQLTQRWKQGASGTAVGQGAGLGLSIVARYAELLGATFSLLPAPEGKGLAAQLRFPGAAAAERKQAS